MMNEQRESREELLEEVNRLRAQVAAYEAERAHTGSLPWQRGEPVSARHVDQGTAEALLRSSPAAIIAVDHKGRVLLWSGAAERMFGWREEEALGQANPIVPPECEGEFRALLARELEDGQSSVDYLCKRRRRDGSLIDVRLSTAPLRDHSGQTIGVVGVLTGADDPPPALPRSRDDELGHLFNNLHEGVWMVDPHGVTTFVNERLAAMIGYPPEQMVGRPAREFVPASASESVEEILRRREARVAETHEFWLPSSDGGGVWCAVSGAPMLDRQGNYVGAVATFKEITARKELEAALEQRVQERTAELTEANRRLQEQIDAREKAELPLRESEARFRLLAENATDLICRHASDGRYLYVSPSARRLLGYEPREMLGRSPYEFFHPEDLKRARDSHAGVLGGPDPKRIEFRFRRRDGSYLWLETIANAVRDAQTGEVIELHSTSRDITSRREAEEQLRLIKCAVEQTEEMVVITEAQLDPPGPRIEYVNPAFCHVTGYAFEEILGQTPRILQGPRTSRKVLDRLRRQLRRGERFEGETWNYRKDGSEFKLHWHITPLRDTRGQITHWVSVQRDVTEQRRQEALARQRQNELAHVGRLSTMGEMASGLAHELNQPLAAIVIYVQACVRRIQDTGMEPSELVDALESVKGQAHRASEIIRRLRDFVRKREPQREPSDLNHLVHEVLGLLDTEVQRQGVQVHLELDEQLPPVRVDSVQIEQVVLNLVRNAVEAMEANAADDRWLTVRTSSADATHATISVRDVGPGMNDEQLARIYEPFFSTKEAGMGMGLNISQSLAQANEGRLWGERNPDRGMTFHLSLPLAR